jgi:hypothetical protein
VSGSGKTGVAEQSFEPPSLRGILEKTLIRRPTEAGVGARIEPGEIELERLLRK